MTTTDRAAVSRQVWFHDETAPVASVVAPSVFVVVQDDDARLLMVRRLDTGVWELPGGQVDVGEAASETAVRETGEEAGVEVVVTGLAGLFTDPGHVVRGVGGQVRQQFVLLVRARPVAGVPRGDQRETSAAAWVPIGDLPELDLEPPVRAWLEHALGEGAPPHLG